MDLAEALDDALRDRYPMREPKRPATHRQGLTTRMHRLEKLFTGGAKGTERTRAAEAAGISPRTWRKWRAGTQAPSPRLLRKLEAAFTRLITVPNFRKSLTSKPVPNRVKISAVIKWAKSPKSSYNAKAGGYRTTTLESMRPVIHQVIRAWYMAGPEAAADTFERGAASVYRSDEIRFEGNNLIIEFPEGDH